MLYPHWPDLKLYGPVLRALCCLAVAARCGMLAEAAVPADVLAVIPHSPQKHCASKESCRYKYQEMSMCPILVKYQLVSA